VPITRPSQPNNAPPIHERRCDMPIMNVTCAAGALDPSSKAALAKRLTDVLIRMEGGANTHGGRAFAWVLFNELGREDWWVGGSVDRDFVAPPGKFLIHVSIPEGYMNAAHKNEVHAWVSNAICETLGEGITSDPALAPGGSILTVI